MKKLVFTLLLAIGMMATGFSQNDKVKEKAQEKVEELNSEIVAGDASLALNEEQREKIYDLQVKRIMETRKLKKDGADKKEMKEANKKYMQQIFKEVLTKEQMKARKSGKDESED